MIQDFTENQCGNINSHCENCEIGDITNSIVKDITAEPLEVSKMDIDSLVEGVEFDPNNPEILIDDPEVDVFDPTGEPTFGNKICPTRHGCTGASSCDSSYGNYPW